MVTDNRFNHLGDRFFHGIVPGSVDPPIPNLQYYVRPIFNLQTPEEKEMSSFINQAAQELAREFLSDRTKTELRGKVEQAVEHLQELVSDTQCGSTLTFMKTNEAGNHYFYAAVKNGERWFTTAQNPRILDDDDHLIEWLIGLEIWEAPQLQLTENRHAAELAAPIDAESTES